MALMFMDGFDNYVPTDEQKKVLADLRDLANEYDIEVMMSPKDMPAASFWRPKEGENQIRFLPGGDKLKYPAQMTVRILKNRNGEEIDAVGNTPAQAAELDELCRAHDEAVEAAQCCDWDTDGDGNCPRHPKVDEQKWFESAWVERGSEQILIDSEAKLLEYFGKPDMVSLGGLNWVDVKTAGAVEELATPDVAANAATLREQLRVETNVRLALSENHDAQNPLFREEPRRYTMHDIGMPSDALVYNEYPEALKQLEKDTEGLTFPNHAIMPY